MNAHQDWVQDALAVVERVGQSFTRPDDDWWPVLLGQEVTGRWVTVDIAEAYVDEQAKEAFAKSLPLFIVEAQLQRVVFVSSSWIVEFAPAEQAQAQQGEWVRAILDQDIRYTYWS
jgi:hypothetical protein